MNNQARKAHLSSKSTEQMIGMQIIKVIIQGSVNCKFAWGSHTPDRSARGNDGNQTIKSAPAFGVHIAHQCAWNIRIPDVKKSFRSFWTSK